MGFLEVFESEENARKVYGASKSDSNALKVYMLECLMKFPFSDYIKDKLTHLYAKYNLGGGISTTTPVITAITGFVGAVASTPTTGADVLALTPASLSTGPLSLVTGTTFSTFIVAIPNSYNIQSVIDTTAANANLTAQYILVSTIPVTINNTIYNYSIFEMSMAIPYQVSHNHEIYT